MVKDNNSVLAKLASGLQALAEKVIALRELMDERDRRYTGQFDASKNAVIDALAAQKEQTSSVFTSSEKAIIKAEDAQRSYNERTNELRGALNDQNKTLLSRTEAEARFLNVEEKIDEIKRDVANLREYRSAVVGKDRAEAHAETTQKWLIGLAIGVMLSMLGSGLSIILFLAKTWPK
jgi:tetrahydromethanopterin S-methyltransferase subunit F